jgi:TolA-binding protein
MRIAWISYACLSVALMAPAQLAAQATLDGRVERLEQELRAVQRKVFPDGAGRTLPAEPAGPTSILPGGEAQSPLTDLQSRVSAVEIELKNLTGQVEQNGFKLKQLQDEFARFKADAASRAVAAPAPATATGTAAAVVAKPAVTVAKPAATATKPAVAATKPDPAKAPANDARKLAVAAIEKPDTGNAADDAFAYGYRLWAAKFYPEAQVQLKATVDKYSASGVASRAHNLLGRAYLDDDKPALASVAFYENYKKRPTGDRAADSLAYLGESLIRLKKLPDACKVYQEFGEVYGATASAALKDLVAKGKARAKCSD